MVCILVFCLDLYKDFLSFPWVLFLLKVYQLTIIDNRKREKKENQICGKLHVSGPNRINFLVKF